MCGKKHEHTWGRVKAEAWNCMMGACQGALHAGARVLEVEGRVVARLMAGSGGLLMGSYGSCGQGSR